MPHAAGPKSAIAPWPGPRAGRSVTGLPDRVVARVARHPAAQTLCRLVSRRLRRILLWSSVPAIVLACAGLVLGLLLLSTPAYYRPPAMEPAALESSARQVEDKLIDLRNAAAEVPPAGSLVVTFGQEELNAFVLKWSELNALRGQYERFVRRPMVAFEPGRLIFAAEASAGPTEVILSLHAGLRLDPSAGLVLSVESVRAGRIPLPEAAWGEAIASLRGEMARQLPGWQRGARLNRSGWANEDAVKAVYARLILDALAGRGSSPVVIIPVSSGRGVPVRVSGLELRDGTTTLTLIPLPAGEREAFIEQLRSSQAGER
jgi:hypothetical protein